MRLLRDGTRHIAFVFGSAELAAAAAEQGWQVRSVAPDGKLARHLGARAGGVVLVRPDAYAAATIDDPSSGELERTLEALA